MSKDRAEIWAVETLTLNGKSFNPRRFDFASAVKNECKREMDTAMYQRIVHFIEADDSPCVWKWMRESAGWETSCGEKVIPVMDATYCPKCGRKIREA